MIKKFDIVVVGGGPAGISLAKITGKKKNIAIIRPEEYSMIYCAMPYAIEGIMETNKVYKKDSIVTDAGATLIRGKVESIDFPNKQLTLASTEKIEYDKIVLAMGATPFLPPIEGINLKGVMGFKTQDDLEEIDRLVKNGLKKAVIVGAGAIGIELAFALNDKGVETKLVDMVDSVLPNLVDKEMSLDLKEDILESGIKLKLNSKVVKLEGEDYVKKVHLDNGYIINFDSDISLVVFAVGMTPDIKLTENSEINIGKTGIIINDKMETNIKDVYAVGDCTEFTSGITGKIQQGKLATNAVPMAKLLGYNFIGQNRKYPGFFNGAATKVENFYVGGTGLSESVAIKDGYETVCGYSEVTTQFPIMPQTKKIKMKLIADKKTHRILGAQVISGAPVTDKIDLLTFAIQKETTVEDMTALSYSAQPYQSFFPAGNLIVIAAEDILKKL